MDRTTNRLRCHIVRDVETHKLWGKILYQKSMQAVNKTLFSYFLPLFYVFSRSWDTSKKGLFLEGLALKFHGKLSINITGLKWALSFLKNPTILQKLIQNRQEGKTDKKQKNPCVAIWHPQSVSVTFFFNWKLTGDMTKGYTTVQTGILMTSPIFEFALRCKNAALHLSVSFALFTHVYSATSHFTR